MKKKQVNAIAVSKKAGVSQSTVSRVFTPGLNVSEKSRRKVLEAAEELGYRPNALARGLIMNKTNMIGLVMSDVQNPFYPEILEKFTKGLRAKGYHLLFVHTENNRIQQDDISEFLEYNVEGVIFTDALLSSNVVSKLQDNNIPVILFNRTIKNNPCHYVCCDNYTAGKEIGHYLINKGHKKLAYISGNENTSTSIERENGFRESLKNNNINLIVEEGGYTYEQAYQTTVNLLKSPNRPEAIFCANDIMALGAIDAAKYLGILIPDELSVVGFDDIKMASWPPYSLTTWKQPVDQMIRETIKSLLNEIENKNTGNVSILLPGNLIERNSVKGKTI
ncbi:LacI family DNA-binding transcriptional regulator [Peribacillus sp. NPDC058002]|uniref:LacI family DNA-binding transcriptional regulator n=1 Tax=Peribacillus sp. NPDC058002 TaxID=3346301 RepID=UPI0036DECF98